MKIELNCGVTVDVEKGVFDDMRIVDFLADIEDGNFLSISRLTSAIFSKEDKKKIYDKLGEANNGRVSVVDFQNLITELMIKLGEQGKN